jgi:hypothetical protein
MRLEIDRIDDSMHRLLMERGSPHRPIDALDGIGPTSEASIDRSPRFGSDGGQPRRMRARDQHADDQRRGNHEGRAHDLVTWMSRREAHGARTIRSAIRMRYRDTSPERLLQRPAIARVPTPYDVELAAKNYEEVRDSGANFFFDWLPAGEYVLKYRLRANMGGTFRVGPATLQSMYAPEFTAYSAGDMMTVAPVESP